MGNEFKATLKCIAAHLAAKWKWTYSKVCGFVWAHLALALAKLPDAPNPMGLRLRPRAIQIIPPPPFTPVPGDGSDGIQALTMLDSLTFNLTPLP